MINGMEMTIGIEDGPGTMLVNGNVLFGAGVRVGPSQSSPSWFSNLTGRRSTGRPIPRTMSIWYSRRGC
jgi:hypothetical protein